MWWEQRYDWNAFRQQGYNQFGTKGQRKRTFCLQLSIIISSECLGIKVNRNVCQAFSLINPINLNSIKKFKFKICNPDTCELIVHVINHKSNQLINVKSTKRLCLVPIQQKI